MSFPLDRAALLRALSLLLGGAIAGLGLNAARPSGVSLLGFEPPTTCSAANGQAGPIIEVSTREASLLCGHPSVLFADTRPAAEFAEGHVADAVHLPCDATARGAEGALRKLDSAQTIIIYGASSDDGRAVAETLQRRGLKAELRVLGGGFRAWAQEGLACASGPCRDCLVTKEQP